MLCYAHVDLIRVSYPRVLLPVDLFTVCVRYAAIIVYIGAAFS